MIRSVIFIVFFITSLYSFGMAEAARSSAFKAGNDAYQKKEWDTAIDQYRSIENDWDAPELFYNMGNAYYFKGDMGHAIYYYKKSLKCEPNQGNVQHNLRIAIQQTEDKLTTIHQTGLGAWWKKNLAIFGADNWAYLSILTSLLLLIGGGLYLLSVSDGMKKVGLALGAMAMLLAVCSFWFSLSAKKNYLVMGHGIVIPKVVTIHTLPDASSEQAFQLHEGTEVYIKNSEDGWYNIRLDDNQQGWVKMSEVKGY